MSTFLTGSEVSGMYLGSNEISEMYLGSNLFYSSGWPYKTLRISTDGGVTWTDYGRPVELARNHFYRMGITHVELPDSVVSIGEQAFRDNKIKNIQLPDSVKTIGQSAFYTNGMESVEFSETLESIGDYAFWGNDITYVEFTETLKSIGFETFFGNELTYVEFPKTLYSIGEKAFLSNPNLSEVKVSSRTSYQELGGTATFPTHTNVVTYSPAWPYKTLRISKDGGVTWEDYGRPEVLEESQFYEAGVTHVELPDSLISIGDRAFQRNEIVFLDIPDSVQTIGGSAFFTNNLTNVYFPETLDSIGDGAFRGNPNLSEVRISRQTTYNTDSRSSTRTFDSNTRVRRY